MTNLVESDAGDWALHDPGSPTVASERVVCRSSGFCNERTTQAPYAVEPVGANLHQKVSQRSADMSILYMEVVEQCVQKAGFLREVVEVIVNDLGKFTARAIRKYLAQMEVSSGVC